MNTTNTKAKVPEGSKYDQIFVVEADGSEIGDLGIIGRDPAGWWYVEPANDELKAIAAPMKLYSRGDANAVMTGLWAGLVLGKASTDPIKSNGDVQVKKVAKKQVKVSRPQRWAAAISKGQDAIEEMRGAQERAVEAAAELREMQEEFEEWKNNLSENLQSTPVAEKLDAITEIDLDGNDKTLEELEELFGEAESAELPLGFGRD